MTGIITMMKKNKTRKNPHAKKTVGTIAKLRK